MKPRTGDGPLEVTKEGRGIVMRVPLEGGGRLVVELSATEAAALGEALGADFADEGDRYRHRDALTGLFTVWFTDHTADEIAATLSATSILWERYRTFADVVTDTKVTDNPLFTVLEQPRIGEYLAPGLPLSIDGTYPKAVASPALGDHTAIVLRDRLGLTDDELGRLLDAGTVA